MLTFCYFIIERPSLEAHESKCDCVCPCAIHGNNHQQGYNIIEGKEEDTQDDFSVAESPGHTSVMCHR